MPRGEAHRVRAFSLHPGVIHTELSRSIPEDELRALLSSPRIAGTMLKTVEQGAATSVWCATSPQLESMGGVYCEDVDIAEPVNADFAGTYGVRPWAIDPALAEQLWKKSEAWTGVSFEG